MEMVRGVFFGGRVRLVRPVNTDLLQSCQFLNLAHLARDLFAKAYQLVHTAAIQRLHGALSCAGIVVLYEAVVEALCLRKKHELSVI